MNFEYSAQEILTQLQELDEHPRLEAKSGSRIGSSIMQTVCAFANEPNLGGGYLLLGVEEPDDSHSTFWVSGLTQTEKLLNELQTNCREQFEQPVSIQGHISKLDNKSVLLVFVPELSVAAKPCTFKGKFDKKNKRKTGAWRRGLNGDYECSQNELEPLLLAKAGASYEQTVLLDAEMDDLDSDTIELYRVLRAKISPDAEELKASDTELLRALNLIKPSNGVFKPTVAGLLLFGKSVSLRRLLPAVRVDYVRVQGTKWVEDAEQRFVYTQDFRQPIISLIPKLEATILDDLPRYFRLQEGQTQRSDEPLLPQRVIREAVVNALMHRDYLVHQPTLIVRFSNRLEIRNAGYSLKPEGQLGEMGSELRNPILSAVLYDLNFAETKGSGIRTMRNLLHNAGLSAPVLSSRHLENQFSASYLLHQFMNSDQLKWLNQFHSLSLSDQEAKALVLTKEVGAIDNAALRSITGLDTLNASKVLKKLTNQRKLLQQGGSGTSTYYQLSSLAEFSKVIPENTGDLDSNTGDLASNTSDLDSNTSDLDSNTSDLDSNISDFPEALEGAISELSPKARKEKLWPIIVWLCNLQPLSAESLAKLLNRQPSSLKSGHLTPLRENEGLLAYLYPEVVNHPEQAYLTTAKGKQWLKQQTIYTETKL